MINVTDNINIFPSSSVRIAEFLGIVASFIIAGFNIGLSFAALPSLLQPYTHPGQTTSTSTSTVSATPSQVRAVAKQWSSIYNRGLKLAPTLALFALANFFYVASAYHHHHQELYQGHHRGTGHIKTSPEADADAAHLKAIWRSFVFAGLLTISIVPFTFAAILKVNKQLYDLTKEKEGTISGSEKDVAASAETSGGDTAKLRALLDQWAQLNYARALLPFLGGAVGLFAAFSACQWKA